MAKAVVVEKEVVEEDVPADAGAGLANALVILTGLMLLAAVFIVLSVLGGQYQEGMLAPK